MQRDMPETNQQFLILPVSSLNEFKEIISQCVAQVINAAENTKAINATPEGYLSRVEAAELLHISLQTLNNRTKAGELVAYRIGTRVLYKRSELTAALAPTNRYRTGRAAK
jgi:excisionase family DNA binding protein